MNNEIWAPISGYETYYEVSNHGRVRSMDRTVTNGKRWKGRTLKMIISTTGYWVVSLSVGSKVSRQKVHRLVAQAFVANDENKPEVNHIDGNKLNACAYNLEWCTHKENGRHASQVLKALNNMPIYGVNIQTGERKDFLSIGHTKDFGFWPQNVWKCLRGWRTHHMGYRWYQV